MKAFLFGYGSIGRRHAKILRQIDDRTTIEISDPFLGFNDVPQGTYDIGLVCTDTSSHLDVVDRLKDACGLIFVEKPLHNSLAEIRRRRPALSGKNVHVGCNVRYTDGVEGLRYVKDKARMVRVTSMSNLGSWRHDPDRRAYSFHRSAGGGVLMDFIHEPDYIRHIFGRPNLVHVSQGRLHDSVTVDSDDSCMMTWEYDKTYVNFCLSYGSNDYVRTIETLNEDKTSDVYELTRDDIESSYLRQWEDILANGPRNSYDDCLDLYEQLLGDRT